MQRLRTVTSHDVSAVAGHHEMPAALLFELVKMSLWNDPKGQKIYNLYNYNVWGDFLGCFEEKEYLIKSLKRVCEKCRSR